MQKQDCRGLIFDNCAHHSIRFSGSEERSVIFRGTSSTSSVAIIARIFSPVEGGCWRHGRSSGTVERSLQRTCLFFVSKIRDTFKSLMIISNHMLWHSKNKQLRCFSVATRAINKLKTNPTSSTQVHHLSHPFVRYSKYLPLSACQEQEMYPPAGIKRSTRSLDQNGLVIEIGETEN